MSLTTKEMLSSEDTHNMGLSGYGFDDAPAFVFPSKASAGTAARYAMDDTEDTTALWRLTRSARMNDAIAEADATGVSIKAQLARNYADHMDRVAQRINALPRDARVDAVRRWKDATGEPCPRGVSLRG